MSTCRIILERQDYLVPNVVKRVSTKQSIAKNAVIFSLSTELNATFLTDAQNADSAKKKSNGKKQKSE